MFDDFDPHSLTVANVWVNSGTYFYLKAMVHPKMKIQSLSTHTHTMGRVGEVFKFTKHYWCFRGKRFAVISQTIEPNGDQDLNVNKMNNKTIKCLHTAHAK